MKRDTHDMFTTDQIATMRESRRVIDLLDEATRGRDSMGSTAVRQLAASLGFVTRHLTLQDMEVSLMRIDGKENSVKRFGNDSSAGTDRDMTLEPFRQLNVIPFGWITIKDDASEDLYRTYRIHEPGQPLHDLGLILAYTVTHVRETLPMEQVLGEAGLSGPSVLTRRLYTAAAHADTLDRAEQFEQLADDSLSQEEAEVDTYYHDNRRIIDAKGARYLSGVMRRVIDIDPA